MCLTLCDPMGYNLLVCDPMGYNLLVSSIRGIFQARILEWVAISSSKGSSWPRDWTQVSRIAGRLFTIWASREADVRQAEIRYHYTSIEMANRKNSVNFKCWRKCGAIRFIVGGNTNWYSLFGRLFLIKLNIFLPYDCPLVFIQMSWKFMPIWNHVQGYL